MNQTTSLAVVEALKSLNLKAYYEYPGYVSVLAGVRRINLNDCGLEGDPLSFDVEQVDGKFLYNVESPVSQSSEDVDRIVQLTLWMWRLNNTEVAH